HRSGPLIVDCLSSFVGVSRCRVPPGKPLVSYRGLWSFKQIPVEDAAVSPMRIAGFTATRKKLR
ncbi:hypothetical protein ACFLFM_003284, partial [Salmonella enterica]